MPLVYMCCLCVCSCAVLPPPLLRRLPTVNLVLTTCVAGGLHLALTPFYMSSSVSVKNIRRLARSYHANRIALIGVCTALAGDSLPVNKSFFVIPAPSCPMRTTSSSNIITLQGSAAGVAAGDVLSASSIDLVIVDSNDTASMFSSIASFWPKLHLKHGTLAVIRSVVHTQLFQGLFKQCGFRSRANFLVVERNPCNMVQFPPACMAAVEVARRSYCPGKRSRWEARIAHLIASNTMVYFNVGANKGYNVAEFLQTFRHDGSSGVSNQVWHSSLNKIDPSVHAPCGICRSTCTRPLPTTTYSVTAKIYAFELLESNVQLLKRLFAEHSVHGEVFHAAVLNYTGAAYAHHARSGEEKFGAQMVRHSHELRVAAITLDDFAQRHSVEHISILDIDAEGSDALVLEGTQRMLSQRSVRILKFEYHAVGMWSAAHPGRRNLKDVISRLCIIQ